MTLGPSAGIGWSLGGWSLGRALWGALRGELGCGPLVDEAFGGVVVIARSWRGRAGWQAELSAKAANRQFVAGAAGRTGAGSPPDRSASAPIVGSLYNH
ncbi:hypothetical protein [Novosphingobium sp. KA1]|uniref:hypothetical protein n=1 Tax=Novosphingobium sp. (strain KA1) TaxID=164608 RepID=UPI001A8E794B|nr:hypothetical protein [Novosphingobium sp. KA1]